MPGVLGRVLVVDDSQVIRQLIRLNLELDGFEVATASDGEECLEAVRRVRPDVITLDLAMPRLDGARTVRRLRGDEGTRRIPLVVVSADVVGRRELPPGVDAVVPKPFEPAELVGVVRRLWREGRRPAVHLAKPLAGRRESSRTLAP
ncbi:response regulator [Streptomyces sp. DSM 44917]|uniref:Response regulator n=1 Tax=Streptomyces boetiae TaxID=3075541 RepID=A0ABU2L6N9_9ACTN|nr:response regulator [Streptomyces sp. DSM 44917]MDT0307185.1 response regulator [Streptomyces sp. DSM 44917]